MTREYLDQNGLAYFWSAIKEFFTGTQTPLMDGTAATGSSTKFARENHVHPTDTTRAPLASPALTGTPTAPTAAAGTNSTQIATTEFVKAATDALDTGVTGVKGNAESSYRTGQVNLTPANIGAAASSHSHGNITSGGDITATAPTIASGDKLIINDESASKVTNGPAFGTDTTKYLRNDGSWAVPEGTTYDDFDGDAHGLVPVGPTPSQDRSEYVLFQNGEWHYPRLDLAIIANGDSPGAEIGLGYSSNRSSDSMDILDTIKIPFATASDPGIIHCEDYAKLEGLGLAVDDEDDHVGEVTFDDEGNLKLKGHSGIDLNVVSDDDGAWIEIYHGNSVNAGTAGQSSASNGATLNVPYVTYDAQGHITASGVHVHTINSLAASAISSGTLAAARIPSLDASKITGGTFDAARIPGLDASKITSGTIDAARLPSYVDDVIEAYPVSGSTALSSGWLSATSGGSALAPETGKIYVLMASSGDYNANDTFRWGGTTYVKLSDGAGISAITNAEIDAICV